MQLEDERPQPYGEVDAELYDAGLEGPADTAAAVELLASHAGEGPVLELGIGAGRVALPLAARNLAVHGIDNSEAMLTRLLAKPGGDRITVTLGDFAEVGVDQTFSLVYVVFDTITALLEQDQQVRCFVNVARHLRPGGVFVVEASVQGATGGGTPPGHSLSLAAMSPGSVQLDASWHDPLTQQIRTQWVMLSEKGARFLPFAMRYVWPSELDLMARIAGLDLWERWGGWSREAYSAASTRHVSIYRRP